jgi:hypothetical protein
MEQLMKFDWRNFKNSTLKRSFNRAFLLLGDSGINDNEKEKTWKSIRNNMALTFSRAQIQINNTTESLEPNVLNLFFNSRNYDELKDTWVKWRDATGEKYHHLYANYVDLSNDAVKKYGFQNYGEYLRSNFETENIQDELDLNFEKIQKLYRYFLLISIQITVDLFFSLILTQHYENYFMESIWYHSDKII